MNLDALQKDARKVYNKQTVNNEEKYIIKWKYFEECRHVKYKYEYNRYLISKSNLEESGGTITYIFGRTMEINLLAKTT